MVANDIFLPNLFGIGKPCPEKIALIFFLYFQKLEAQEIKYEK
jgi:hypothetical protein